MTIPVLQEYTAEDSNLQELYKKGMRRTESKTNGFAQCFDELSLQRNAAHVGHPGKDRMLKQLRTSTWWPGMTANVNVYERSCTGCSASGASNAIPPMKTRDIPDRPWQHLSADYKEPNGGNYYFHMLIDNYKRWP